MNQVKLGSSSVRCPFCRAAVLEKVSIVDLLLADVMFPADCEKITVFRN